MKIKNLLRAILLTACLTLANAPEALCLLPTVKLGDELVKLEVASTAKEVQQGLMWRTSLPETQGMVFLFKPQQEVAFWMFNCFISLDMLFIKDGKVLRICKNVPPCKSKDPSQCPTYPQEGRITVDQVIEVAAGFCDRHNVKEGDSIHLDLKP